MTTANLFEIDNLKVSLGGAEVLDIPSLDISGKKVTAITGPNGSGKTTLLQVLGGLLEPAIGTVRHRGRDLFTGTSATDGSFRKDFGIVLQSPYLFKTTVTANVGYSLIRRGVSRAQASKRAEKALELVGLGGFGKRSYSALSGGETQRVALARALVLEPEILLLDEPFANVDTVSRSVIERVLLEENRERKTSVVFTTHDIDQAYRLADSVVTLFEGSVHQGSMENLFHGKVSHKASEAFFDTGRLQIAIPLVQSDAVTASIPPEAVIVSRTHVSTSARNSHKGRITSTRERNDTVDVVVDVGELLVARITKRSYQELGLMLGQEVYMVFKAEAVKLY